LLNQIAEERLKNRLLQGKAFTVVLDRYKKDIKDIPELGTLLVTDAAGRIQAATDASIIGLDVSHEPYFAAHLDRRQMPKLFMSRPDKRLLGTTSVAITLPIISDDHQFLGIVGATVGFKFFRAYCKRSIRTTPPACLSSSIVTATSYTAAANRKSFSATTSLRSVRYFGNI